MKWWIITIIGLILVGTLIGIEANFSVISNIEGFNNCKIIKEGNVCDYYTDCIYDIDLDKSCIKGDRIAGVITDEPTSQTPIVIDGGGSG